MNTTFMDIHPEAAHKIIGIVGGMGPHAGTALFNTILDSTHARLDQEYPSIVLVSFPKHLSDRTLYLTGEETINPAYEIVRMIGKLYAAGATVIGMACNTAYSPAIYEVILHELERQDIAVDMVHMPLETYRWIKNSYPEAKRVGIMGTNGTYLSGVYRQLFNSMGYEVIVPDAQFQDRVIHKMIYDPDIGIKAHPAKIRDEVHVLADRAIQFFERQRTDVIVLGCTELSLLFKQDMVRGIPLVDSLKAMACALIRHATAAGSEHIKIKQYDRFTGTGRQEGL